MNDADGKHVFISYVREDSDLVDALCAILEGAQIPYWRDRADLGPGDAWRAKIREAIREESLVFLACFSDNSRAKSKSYMNEELTLAVDEFRKMPPGRVWLIPVRFDDGHVPEWDLGAGRLLSDLNYSDHFGPDHMKNAARLVSTVMRLNGEKRPDPATTLAAVEQAANASRTDLLKRMTKEMLLDPTRRIELDDMVSQEVQRVLAVLSDGTRVARPLAGSNDEQVVQLAEQAQELWQITEPFCASLQVAARWGSADALAPWANGIRSFASAATKTVSGNTALINLRHLPAVAALTTAGIACVSTRNWSNLKALVIDPTVRDTHERASVSALVATDPYKPFSSADIVINVMARAATTDESLRDAIKAFNERQAGKFYTAMAEWMHSVLRPLFTDQWPDDDAFAHEFDRAEVGLGVVSQDASELRNRAEGRSWRHTNWFGRSTWRAAHGHGSPVEDFKTELAREGKLWPPLVANLFGGEVERAETALASYEDDFNRMARARF